jgi:hypothetical protein
LLIVLGVCVLFIAVDIALEHGLRDVLASWVGSGTGTSDLLRVSAVVTISAWRFAWQGSICVPATFAAALALALV